MSTCYPSDFLHKYTSENLGQKQPFGVLYAVWLPQLVKNVAASGPREIGCFSFFFGQAANRWLFRHLPQTPHKPGGAKWRIGRQLAAFFAQKSVEKGRLSRPPI